MRIKNKRKFSDILAGSVPWSGSALKIFSKPSTCPRIGISIGRKYGSAVKRNRFKRLVREAFRKLSGSLPCLDYIVLPLKTPEPPSFSSCLQDLKRYSIHIHNENDFNSSN